MDNIRQTPPPLAPPATTTTNVTPSKIAGTSAHSKFWEGSGYTHTSPMAILDPYFMFIHRHTHLALLLLADLKSTQDVLVDKFLTGLLWFVRDGQAPSEPQQPTASAPDMSLSSLISQVGVNVANLFCQMSGMKPLEAAVSTTSAKGGKGYSHGLLQDLWGFFNGWYNHWPFQASCKVDTKTKRYLIFCKIVNSILVRTKNDKWPGFLNSSDLNILLQNTSLFGVNIYHQGEESMQKPDCTSLPSTIAGMYHEPSMLMGGKTRSNLPAELDQRDQLWNVIVNKVTGMSLTKSMHMHMDWDAHHTL